MAEEIKDYVSRNKAMLRREFRNLSAHDLKAKLKSYYAED